MKPRTSSPSGFEPSVDAVAALQQRLQRLGFLIDDEAARGILRAVLSVETDRLDRHAHEAAAECLRSIQSAAREALHLLTRGPADAGPPAPDPARTVPIPAATPTPRSAGEPVNLAEVVRRRLGEDLPRDSRPVVEDDRGPSQPAPRALSAEPRRPVIKHPRKR